MNNGQDQFHVMRLDSSLMMRQNCELVFARSRFTLTLTFNLSAICSALDCTALHCTALHCTALHCTALHYTTVDCTALYYTTMHYTILNYTTLRYTTVRYSTNAMHYQAILFLEKSVILECS